MSTKVEHYPCKCTHCNPPEPNMTFHIENGAKVLDGPCPTKNCPSKEYYSAKAVSERAKAEEKERERIEIAQGKREPPKKKESKAN